MSGWGINEWVAAGSAVLAFVSFILNLLIVRRQSALQVESFKAQLDEAVLQWAQEAIDLLSAAIALAKTGDVQDAREWRLRLVEVSQKLSGIADRGRLFFPNEIVDGHGNDKEAAFRGYRPAVLDALILAHLQLDRLPDRPSDAAEAAEYLIRCRRLLVSEVQGATDPRRKSRMLRELGTAARTPGDDNYGVVKSLMAELSRRYPDTPTRG